MTVEWGAISIKLNFNKPQTVVYPNQLQIQKHYCLMHTYISLRGSKSFVYFSVKFYMRITANIPHNTFFRGNFCRSSFKWGYWFPTCLYITAAMEHLTWSSDESAPWDNSGMIPNKKWNLFLWEENKKVLSVFYSVY